MMQRVMLLDRSWRAGAFYKKAWLSRTTVEGQKAGYAYRLMLSFHSVAPNDA